MEWGWGGGGRGGGEAHQKFYVQMSMLRRASSLLAAHLGQNDSEVRGLNSDASCQTKAERNCFIIATLNRRTGPSPFQLDSRPENRV